MRAQTRALYLCLSACSRMWALVGMRVWMDALMHGGMDASEPIFRPTHAISQISPPWRDATYRAAARVHTVLAGTATRRRARSRSSTAHRCSRARAPEATVSFLAKILHLLASRSYPQGMRFRRTKGHPRNSAPQKILAERIFVEKSAVDLIGVGTSAPLQPGIGDSDGSAGRASAARGLRSCNSGLRKQGFASWKTTR